MLFSRLRFSPPVPTLISPQHCQRGFGAEHWGSFSSKNSLRVSPNDVLFESWWFFLKGRSKGMADGKRAQPGCREERRVIQVWRLIHHLQPALQWRMENEGERERWETSWTGKGQERCSAALYCGFSYGFTETVCCTISFIIVLFQIFVTSFNAIETMILHQWC